MSDIEGLSAQEEAAFAAMQNETPVETPEPEKPETEAEPEADDAPEPTSRKPSTVPHQALHEERERRKKVESDYQTAREQIARFDERLRILQERSQPQPEPVKPPNPEEDPIAALTFLQDQYERRSREETEQRQRYEQDQRQQTEYQQFVGTYRQQVDSYAKTEPAMREAYNHFVKSRLDEIQAIGYDAQTAADMFKDEELRIAAVAMQQGVNPGERIVSLAKMRGWAAKAPLEDAEERIETTRDAVTRGKSLGSAGGGAAITEMTVAKLLSMPDDEFDAWTSKNPAKTKKLMGS